MIRLPMILVAAMVTNSAWLGSRLVVSQSRDTKQTNDLRLSDFVVERMSPSPGELNSFGESEISEFTIDDFAYDSLQQLPYQANKQEMQSLEFLQGLAAGQ